MLIPMFAMVLSVVVLFFILIGFLYDVDDVGNGEHEYDEGAE